MGGPNKAFSELGQLISLLCFCLGAKGTDANLEGLPFE